MLWLTNLLFGHSSLLSSIMHLDSLGGSRRGGGGGF